MLVALFELFWLDTTAGVSTDPLNAHSVSLGCGEECVYVKQKSALLTWSWFNTLLEESWYEAGGGAVLRSVAGILPLFSVTCLGRSSGPAVA